MGRYLDEWKSGDEVSSYGQTLTQDGIIAFAALYDPQNFHIDVEAANRGPYGGLIASGFQTLSITFRMFLDSAVFAGVSLGSPGIDELRWLAPVRPGDTIHAVARVIDVRASASKPDRGILRLGMRTVNQTGLDVMTCIATVFIATRPAPSS